MQRPISTHFLFLVFIFSAVFLTPKISFAQADVIEINGLVKDERSNRLLAGVVVQKIEDGKLVDSITTGVNGRFIMLLKFGHNYDIKFGKNGYVGKFINMNTTNVPDEDQVGGFGFDLNMNLFEEIEGVNFDILKQPVGKAKFDASSGEIAFDFEYTRSMLSKIAELRRALEKKYKEEEEKLLADQKAAEEAAKKQAKFDALVQEGDGLMTNANYMNAIFKYSEALDLIPDVPSVVQKLEKAKKALEEDQANKEVNEKYNAFIADADKLFQARKYEDAKAKYKSASGVKPNEIYPKTKVEEINGILGNLAAQKELDDNYKAALAAGDVAFKKQDFKQSISEYQKALALKKDEKYPADQIKLANQNISELEAQKALDANYAKAISEADAAFKSKKYDDAIKGYNTALTFKANENYPKDQIAAANKAKADAAAAESLDKQYNDAIADADKLFGSEKWNEAKTAYGQAIALKSEEYPKGQVAKIDAKLAELAAKNEADKSYNDAITSADKLFAEKKFQESIVKYQVAASIKPNESYPKDQISKANAELKTIADAEALNKKYNDLVASADAQFGKGEFQTSIATYKQALEIKSKEAYPKDQITKAEAEIKKANSEAEKRKEYDALVAQADASYNQKGYADAIKTYTKALGIYPSETYPKDQIAAANKAIADAAAADALNKQYNNAIAAADKLFGSEKWNEAKTAYSKAIELKSEEYPKGQIVKIDAKLAEIAANNEANKSYNDAIGAADKLFADKKFQESIGKYETALGIKPNETYPKDQIAKANAELKTIADANALDQQYKDLVASADAQFGKNEFQTSIATYNKALAIKSKESYPKEQIAKAEAALKKLTLDAEKRKEYDAKIAEADASLRAKTYDDAIKLYSQASEMYPNESYPKEQISKANAAIKAIADAEATRKEYDAVIKTADGLLKKKSYAEAIASYQKASGLLPSETYPKDKITEAQSALNALADKKELENNYNQKIADADALLAQSKWNDAKATYQEASGLKPMEDYPVSQIAKIDAELAKQAEADALNTKYKNLVTSADDLMAEKKFSEAIARYNEALKVKAKETYPKDKIAEAQAAIRSMESAQELKNKYDAAIAEGDNLFGQADYTGALASYENAKALIPAEPAADAKIKATKAKLSEQAELAEKQRLYQEKIALADKSFLVKNWSESVTIYNQALAILPNEQYPKDKIAEAEANLAKIANEKEKIDAAYQAAVSYADEQFEAKDYLNAVTAYQNALNYKPSEKYPKDQIAEANRRIEEAEALAAKKKADELLAQSTEVPKEEEKKETKVVSFTDMTSFGDSDEIKKKAQEEARKEQENEKTDEAPKIKVPITTVPPEDLDGYRKMLGENYPEGVTKETIKEGNKTFYRTVIVENKLGDEFLKVDAKFGIFYFKNGLTIKSSDYTDGVPN